jgi:hypothetical protein
MSNEPEAVTTDPTARLRLLDQMREEEFNRLAIEHERAMEEKANQWWEEQVRHDAAEAEQLGVTIHPDVLRELTYPQLTAIWLLKSTLREREPDMRELLESIFPRCLD